VVSRGRLVISTGAGQTGGIRTFSLGGAFVFRRWKTMQTCTSVRDLPLSPCGINTEEPESSGRRLQLSSRPDCILKIPLKWL